MATFSLSIPTVLSPTQAWQAVWNLERHSEVIPFTRLRGSALSADALQPGEKFVARTALGPFGFDDAMRVVRFDAPGPGGSGCAVIEKTGRVIRGQLTMTVRAVPGGSVVTWEQDIHVLGVPSQADPLTARVAAGAYEQVLRRLLAAETRTT